jgi:hypothetical protein
MTMKGDEDFTFEPVPTDPPIVEAEAVHPATAPSKNSTDPPSDTGILVGCGLVGWVVGGPFLALLTTLGGNFAKSKPGPIGDSTRVIGHIADSAGKKAREEDLLGKLKASIRSLFGRNTQVNPQRCETCERHLQS